MVSPLASRRGLRWLAAGIVGALVLAVACFYVAGYYELKARLAEGGGGLFPFLGGGPPASDVRLGSAPEPRSLQATATGFYCGTLALLVAAAAGTVWCGWQTRHELRRWHWFSFLGLGLLGGILTLGTYVIDASRRGIEGVLVFDLLALVCAIVDLTRRDYGAPGRIVSVSVCLLAGVIGALFAIGGAFR
ncbi:MAG TPA: hypothetical protein VFV94_07350 [Polyangiaceae bacterium]|nr:hypothetical protein [Polyangiaceae bacterium]